MDVFKSFKAKVKLQLIGKKIKAVKFERGGEYYDKYDRSGERTLYQIPKNVKTQYTLVGKSSMNGVAKRQNITIKDIVRSMIRI